MYNDGLSLGEFIDKLKKLPKEAVIQFDFGGSVPTEFESYRGYYSELALGFTGEYGITMPTVKRLLELAEAAVGDTFQGWKGGDHEMSRETSLFVANPGNTSDTFIKDVRKKYDDWYEIVTEEAVE
jgi:hypothetical protein